MSLNFDFESYFESFEPIRLPPVDLGLKAARLPTQIIQNLYAENYRSRIHNISRVSGVGSCLFELARNGDLQVLESILNEFEFKPLPNFPLVYQSPIHGVAIGNPRNADEVLGLLSEKGFDINVKAINGKRALAHLHYTAVALPTLFVKHGFDRKLESSIVHRLAQLVKHNGKTSAYCISLFLIECGVSPSAITQLLPEISDLKDKGSATFHDTLTRSLQVEIEEQLLRLEEDACSNISK